MGSDFRWKLRFLPFALLALVFFTALAERSPPDITVSQNLSRDSANVGEKVTVALRISNPGNLSREIEVIAVVPSEMAVPGLSGENIRLWQGYLAPAESRTLEYSVQPLGKGIHTVFTIVRHRAGGSWAEIYLSSPLYVEVQRASAPLDSDGDGWPDDVERAIGTNPFKVDTDRDGLPDPRDPNPLVPESRGPGEAPFLLSAVALVAGLSTLFLLVTKRR